MEKMDKKTLGFSVALVLVVVVGLWAEFGEQISSKKRIKIIRKLGSEYFESFQFSDGADELAAMAAKGVSLRFDLNDPLTREALGDPSKAMVIWQLRHDGSYSETSAQWMIDDWPIADPLASVDIDDSTLAMWSEREIQIWLWSGGEADRIFRITLPPEVPTLTPAHRIYTTNQLAQDLNDPFIWILKDSIVPDEQGKQYTRTEGHVIYLDGRLADLKEARRKIDLVPHKYRGHRMASGNMEIRVRSTNVRQRLYPSSYVVYWGDEGLVRWPSWNSELRRIGISWDPELPRPLPDEDWLYTEFNLSDIVFSHPVEHRPASLAPERLVHVVDMIDDTDYAGRPFEFDFRTEYAGRFTVPDAYWCHVIHVDPDKLPFHDDPDETAPPAASANAD